MFAIPLRSGSCLSLLAAAQLLTFLPQPSYLRRQEAVAPESVRAAHVLNRLTFGARPGDLEKVLQMGVDRWIEQQLQPELIADATTDSANTTASGTSANRPAAAGVMRVDTVRIVNGQVVRVARVRIVSKLLASRSMDPEAITRMARAHTSERQLEEVILDFWQNHFSIFRGKMPSPQSIGNYHREAIRPHALGRFRDLLGAVARTPAMLFYLDNHLSMADSQHRTLSGFQAGAARRVAGGTGLNENYARELLELHTLGVDGGYTQDDVINVARAFTGWTIQAPISTGGFLFDSTRHDADAKVVLGKALAEGRGIEDGEDVLDMLARHPSTANFIARKLATRLVSDAPPEALIARAAATFTRTDGDIREVVRSIVTSPEFFAPAAFRAKVRTPAELVLAMRRALAGGADNTPATVLLMTELNQSPWGKETPDGWPETGAPWMSSGSMFNRIAVAMRAAAGEIPSLSPDSSATWREVSAMPFDSQVAAVIRIILAGNVSRETRAALESARPAAAADAVANASGQSLRDLLTVALSSPEFQRR
jgi:uncharacterized protein (DUF1800 family)